MEWWTEDAEEVPGDLDAIFEHLHASHLAFGESPAAAARLAEERVVAINRARFRLVRTPRIGTRHMIGPQECRQVTMDRAIYWFELHDDRRTIRFLGIFHGGQDHLGRMMRRLGAGGD